jgi:hypothetical protein
MVTRKRRLLIAVATVALVGIVAATMDVTRVRGAETVPRVIAAQMAQIARKADALYEVRQVYKAAHPWGPEPATKSVTCVSESKMRKLTGYGPALGLADVTTRDVWFDRQSVCYPILKYLRTGRLTDATLTALITVGHETAHLRSDRYRDEQAAECFGTQFAFRWLSQQGTFDRYDRQAVINKLRDNRHRAPGYWLERTCQLLSMADGPLSPLHALTMSIPTGLGTGGAIVVMIDEPVVPSRRF